MSMSDSIADMLTRIRNAQMVRHVSVSMYSSKMKVEIARVMHEEGYILSYKTVDISNNRKNLVINLRYHKGQAVIGHISRFSKPGCRVYRGASAIPKVMNGLGTCIVSTSRGIMADSLARKLNIGGELICSISC